MIASLQPSIFIIKNSSNPLSVRKQQLESVMHTLNLQQPKTNYNLFVEDLWVEDQVKELPEVLQSLYTFSKFQLSNNQLSGNHIISILFLDRIERAGYLPPLQTLQIGNKLIDLVIELESQEDNNQIEHQFFLEVLKWIQKLLIQESESMQYRSISQLINNDDIVEKELSKLLMVRLHSEDRFLNKVFFFVRVNGLNINTSVVFSKAIQVVQMLNKKIYKIAELLKTKIVLRRDEQQMVEVFQKLKRVDHSQNIEEMKKLIYDLTVEISTVFEKQGGFSPRFIKMQRMMQICGIQDRLFSIVQSFPNKDVCKMAFKLLSLSANNSYWSCQKTIKYLEKSKLPLYTEDWGQYQVIAQLTEILIQPHNYGFVTKLISNKKYIPYSDNKDFIEILYFLSVQFPEKSKLIRLIHGSPTLKILLNTPSNKQFATNDISYAIKCIKFLNNLNPREPIKEFTEAIGESLNLISLFFLIKRRNFYIEPNKQNLQELILEANLFKLIYEYNLYQGLKVEDLNNILMDSLQGHLKMMRSYTPHSHQNCLLFIESEKLEIDEYDIIAYCCQFVCIILVLCVRQLAEGTLSESSKLSLRRMGLLVSSEITVLLENYMTQKQYQQKKGPMNKLLKLMHKDFDVEPQLKYYYNYNSEPKTIPKAVMEDSIFKKQKYFMQEYELNRKLFEYSFSQRMRDMIKKEDAFANERLQMIINRYEANFINHLVFILDTSTQEVYHGIACRMILKLLEFDRQDLQNLVIQSKFVDVFYKLLESRSAYTNQLLLISHKLIRRNSKEINKKIQRQFQKGLEQSQSANTIQVMKEHLEQLLQIEFPDEPVIKQVERYLKHKVRDPNYSSFHIGILIIIFIQYVCQSLNLGIKSMFGHASDKAESILVLLIKLMKVMIEDTTMISRYKTTILVQCLKTISSLIRGPHIKNIQRALHHGYHRALLSILLIDDSLFSIIQKVNGVEMRKQIASRSYLKFLSEGNQNFYKTLLQPEIVLRQDVFDIRQISSLKSLALSEVIIIMDFLNKNTLKMFFDVCKKSMLDFMEKARRVYGQREEDLENLVINKKINNVLDKIIALDVRDILNDNSELDKYQLEIQESLHLQMGINLFIVMSKYEQRENLLPIKQSVYKYLNSMRLEKRYNQKAGIFYQFYRLIKDVISLFAGLIMRIFKIGESVFETQKEVLVTDEDRYRQAIDFFAKNIANIEVRIDGKDTFISFPLLLEERCINKSIRRDLTRNMDYSTNTERLRTFMNRMDTTLLRIKQQRKLSKLTLRNKVLGIIIKNRQLWKNLSFLAAVLQNVVLLAEDRVSQEFSSNAFYSVRAWQYFLALLLLIIFIFQSFRLRILLAEKELEERKSTNRFYKCIYTTWFIFTDKTFLFVVYYVIVTTIGIRWEVAVSMLLLDFFYRFKATRFLLEMVIYVWPSLLTNIMFFIVILYLVILLVGNQSTQQFYGLTCQSYAACFQMSFYTMAEIQSPNSDISSYFHLGPQGVISTSLIILAVLAYRGLFFGIMIDQKRKVRKERTDLQRLIKQKCCICGLSKAAVNKQEGMEKGFKKHIQMHHNMWNYVYYLSYISELSSQQITLQQQIILSQLKNKSYDWIPLKQI